MKMLNGLAVLSRLREPMAMAPRVYILDVKSRTPATGLESEQLKSPDDFLGKRAEAKVLGPSRNDWFQVLCSSTRRPWGQRSPAGLIGGDLKNAIHVPSSYGGLRAALYTPSIVVCSNGRAPSGKAPTRYGFQPAQLITS